MTGPWWAGLPAAEARLDCGGQPHRLRWAAGQLTAPDHTDLAGEQILSALAGQGFPCLDVLESWAQHAADLRVLILASRGPADPLATWTPPPSRPGRLGRPGWMVRSRGRSSHAVLSYGPPDDPDGDLLRLIGLGGLLPDRLAATVIAAWTQRLRDQPVLLRPVLVRRRRPGLARWPRPGPRCTRRCTGGSPPRCGPGLGGGTCRWR